MRNQVNELAEEMNQCHETVKDHEIKHKYARMKAKELEHEIAEAEKFHQFCIDELEG